MKEIKKKFSELSKELQEKLKKDYHNDIQKLQEMYFTKDGRTILED